MLVQNDGMFYGYMPLKQLLPEGNYTLRAYTRYMMDLGDDYFFKKNIRIGKLSSSLEKSSHFGGSNHVEDDFDVSFFPEGGNLIEGFFAKLQ